MATKLIQNACIAGALGGLMAGRFVGSFTAADYADVVDAAAAIGDEFLTENTASGAALADADNTEIGYVVQAAAFAATFQTGSTSTTAADYLKVAKQIYASSKQALASLV